MKHVAPVAVILGCIAVLAWYAVAKGPWVLVGSGAMATMLWALVRLETGVWVNSFGDIEYVIKADSNALEASRR